MSRAVRLLAMVFCLLVPLTAWAVKPEVVTLEEEPEESAPAPKKKKRKKKKRAAPVVEESVEVTEEVAEEEEEESEPEPPKRRKKKEPPPPAEEKEPEEPPAPIDCMPELIEVETRRPIPLACTIQKDVSAMELRYRGPGDQWKTTKMKKVGEEWQTEIPCAATVKAGDLEFSVSARSKKSKTAGKLDVVRVKIAESTNEPPPSIPGQEPPARCFDPSECPGDMLGSPACPGTVKGKGVRSWGASCADSSECTKGLACVAGTCESPPKCDSDAECESGVCTNGACEFPDPDELKDRLGPPRFNWLGLEFGVDLALQGTATGVCSNETGDGEDFDCFAGGSQYSGRPNLNNAGNVESGVRISTMRAMASYYRAFGRILAGGRVGFAFRGSPEGFLPLHLEGRVAYSLASDPLKRRLRTYLGLGLGVAQVDTRTDVSVITCSEGTDQACVNALQINQAQIMTGQAKVENLTAYRSGAKFFAGPTFMVMYALSEESAIVGNMNVMFPDLVFAPSVGYMLGL